MVKMKRLLTLASTVFVTYGVVYAAQIEDHADISGPFKTPMEVTKTCLECHDTASTKVMTTSH